MVKAKQPSKRQREMAARYCDAAASWWIGLVHGSRLVDPESDWADTDDVLLGAMIADHVDLKHMDSTGGVLPGHVAWAEAAAWLRSGEDLP